MRFSTLSIVIILCFSLIPLNSSSTASINFYRPLQMYDSNNDRIADQAFRLINRENVVDKLFISFNPSKLDTIRSKLAHLPFEELSHMEHLNTLTLQGDYRNVELLQNLEGVNLIDENTKFRSHLAYSAHQVGVRPTFWDLGLTGISDQSVAILDSGIDITHPSLQDKVVGWADFAGEFLSVSGDEYKTPNDYEGHGTHIASIVAGYQESVSSEFITSFEGRLPGDENILMVGYIPYQSKSFSATVGIDWGSEGVDDFTRDPVEIYLTTLNDIETIYQQGITDNTGFDEVEFSLEAGGYYVWVSGSPSNQYMEGWIEAKLDDNIPSTGSKYYHSMGLAHSAKLVGVKVLDDIGDGDVDSILNGIDWILDNYVAYNITVVNFSLGANQVIATIDNAVQEMAEVGILTVVSAGNDGPEAPLIGSPGSAPYAITVGAVNRYNEIAYYSSKGNSDVNNPIKPDIVAPGGSYVLPAFGEEGSYEDGIGLIYAADSNQRGFQANNDDLIGYQGTSMAAPHIAGIAMLLINELVDQGLWESNLDSVLKVKQLLVGSTFEVANIGEEGGEKLPDGQDQLPTIQRFGKDYYEGWGMVNAKAALGFLREKLQVNNDIDLSFALNDPFQPNSYGAYIETEKDREYQITIDGDGNSDFDLIILKETPNDVGDPDILISSMTASADEEVEFIAEENGRVYILIRLVDSTRATSDLTLSILNDFVPFVSILNYKNNDAVNSQNIRFEFESATGFVELWVDNAFVEIIETGQLVSLNLAEGYHTFQLIERNEFSETSATEELQLYIDNTSPTVNVEFTQGMITTGFNISYVATDNFGINIVNLLIDGVLQQTSNHTSGNFSIIPNYFLPGQHTIEIEVVDKAGNTVSATSNLEFGHSTYLLQYQNSVIEVGSQENITITWEASSLNPSEYAIWINGRLLESGDWSGGNVQTTVDGTIIADYEIRVSVENLEGLNLSSSRIISIKDTIAPSVILSKSIKTLDASQLHQVQVDISDYQILNASILLGDKVVFTHLSPSTSTISQEIALYSNRVNIVEELYVISFDTSGNSYESSSKIHWVDATRPELSEPQDLEILVGDLGQLEWTWKEKFQENLEVKLNGVTIAQEAGNLTKEFLYELENLSEGYYIFTLSVSDAGKQSASSIVSVLVGQPSATTREEGNLYAFSVMFATITTIIMMRKVYAKFQQSTQTL